MKTRFRFLALAGLLALAPLPAFANSALMCQGDVSGASSGARTIGGTASAMPSGTLYVLNSAGCTLVIGNDIGFFLSQGFTNLGGGTTSLVFTAQTTGFNFSLPASAFIRNIMIQETAGNSIANTAGINFGSTNGASDIAKMAGTASQLIIATDVSLANRIIAATGAQAVFVTSGQQNGFGTAIFNFTIEYGFL